MSRMPPHPFDDDRFIGNVTLVGPSSIHVNLPLAGSKGSRLHHGQRIGGGEVGEFVIVECDEIGIFGRVLNVRLPERERLSVESSLGSKEEVHPVGVVQLLATVNLAFRCLNSGIGRHPRLGSRVYAAHPELVRWVVSETARRVQSNQAVSLNLACLSNDQSMLIALKPEILFGRHCAVLGTTGGGKSWTVATMIEESLRFHSKLILIDATGEFWRLAGERISHVTLGSGIRLPSSAVEVSFPHSDLNESDLFALFRPSGQSQGPKLREAIRSLRLVEMMRELGDESGNLIKQRKSKRPIEDAFSLHSQYVNSPRSYFSAAALSKQIREECVYPTDLNNKHQYGNISTEEGFCLPLMMRIESIISSPDYACLFDPGDVPTVCETIEKFLTDSNKSLLRISLQNVSFGNYAREIVANAIGRFMLEKGREGFFREQPIVVFLDEAHQFLDRTIGDEHLKVELDSFGLIAKEGRKYGLTICIATQRPRDIPQDVLSQMGTLVVHRLINHQDREVVERAAGEIDRSAAEFLPTLGPGEAIIIGVDIPVPMAIQVNVPISKPDSQGPNYDVYWSLPLSVSVADLPHAPTGIHEMEMSSESEYIRPDGNQYGPACKILLGGKHEVTVGEGSIIEFERTKWEICVVDVSCKTLSVKRVP